MPTKNDLVSNQEMLHFLNEASEALFSSLTMEDELIFDEISRLIVPRLADWFAIEIYDKEEGFKLLSLAHTDPEKVDLAHELREKYTLKNDRNTGVHAVIRSGQLQAYFEITDEMYEISATDDHHLHLLREIGFQSVVVAPLKVRNHTFGAITFVHTKDSNRNYSNKDLAPIESFANKVAIAIDNKRLYETAQKEIESRKKNEEKIRDLLAESRLEQQRLDEFIRTIPGMVWETKLNPDNSQTITFMSEYAEKVMGYPVEEWYEVPNFWESIAHKEDKDKTRTNAEKTYKNGSGENQYRWISRSGEVVWTETKSFVLYDEKQQPIGMRGITFDITRLKELEARRDEFLGIASHELKTPITSAKIIAQCLQSDLERYQTVKKDLTKKLDQQLDKLTHLIDSMLDVNRLQENRLAFHNEPFDLNVLVKEVVDTFRIIYPNTFEIHGDIEKKICADRERINQVLVNLLTNAVKYSEKGKAITIILQDQEETVCVKVEDKGVGIEAKYLNKVFEKFFRIPDPNIKFVSGMGIGLNICQQIINQYKGSIWVESEKGKGSCFCFSIPSAQVC